MSGQSGKRDSNPRPQPWQGCALPTELFPRSMHQRAERPSEQPDGGEGNRTPDLLNAIQALSQLSYAPGPDPCRATTLVRATLAAGNTKYSRRVVVSQRTRAGANVSGRYFAAPSHVPTGLRRKVVVRRPNLHSSATRPQFQATAAHRCTLIRRPAEDTRQ